MTSLFLNPRALAVFTLACACATSASAQASKQALATELAQIQLKTDGPILTEQLSESAAQPLLQKWAQQLQAVPADRQQSVREQLNAALQTFNNSNHQAIQGVVGKAANEALIPVFMDKLTESELRTIVTFMKSPASAKFQSLGADATNAWAQKVVDATRASVEGNANTFDAAAAKIVGVPASAAPAAPPKRK